MSNRLFYGDNLDVLRRKIATESVDLCYIDPPFNSKRNYFQIYNNQGSEDRAQAQAFVDTWEWGDEAIEGLAWIVAVENLSNGKLTEQTVELIKGLEKVLRHGSLLAYLVHMTLRIVEIHRVLKPTGSFYLHCDPTASHYLKLVLDSIFCAQGGDFLNEIIWCYAGGGVSKNWFARKHDTILYYAKSGVKTFNQQYRPYSQGTLQRGRTKVKGKYFQQGLREEGTPVNDWWPDLPKITSPTDPEKMGYPTQKPEVLLERIIKASSNEGDVVLDAYCGCGTTVAVAQRLGRQWIGIDITYQSISLIMKRLQDQYKDGYPEIEANVVVDGVPRDLASAKALANRADDRTRKEFEKWAVLTYSNNQARINERKGADAGIDGIAHFLINKDVNGKGIFQVKSGKSRRSDLATLNSDRMREKAEFGFLITFDMPTSAMHREIAEAGRYRHPMLAREDDRLQVITVAEILAGKRLDLPMARIDAVKAAAALADADKQIGLL
ncbi:MAG: methyltransferase [Sphingomonas bacterium]|nr:methyltransferase [Sphingomonas bacterium]